MMQGILLALTSVFISSLSQVLLKKSAMEEHESTLAEYLNWKVIVAYAIFVLATLLFTLAYRTIPLSMGPLLDATGYLYVTAFGVLIFGEKLDVRKLIALAIIICGIIIYSTGL